MNDLIQKIQEFLADSGAPEWLQRPSAWLMIGCASIAAIILLRRLLKRAPAAVAAPSAAAKSAPIEDEDANGVFGALTGPLAAQIPESEKERKEFNQMLRQAGIYGRSARASIYAYRFLLMAFPLFCAGILAVFSPREQTWKILLVGGLIATCLSIIPRLYVWYRRSVRIYEITAGLADMLDMLSMCLSGGMSISSSLDHVAKNLATYPALSQELQIMRRQSDVGSLRAALTDWANRIDTPEVRQVATLLARGDSLGTSMTGTLQTQADHFRTARKQLATLQANRMPVWLTFPLLFCFAPAVLIILMAPSFMQLGEFLSPSNSDNPLANNETIQTGRIIDQIQSLDQNISAIEPTSGATAPRRPSLQRPPASPPSLQRSSGVRLPQFNRQRRVITSQDGRQQPYDE